MIGRVASGITSWVRDHRTGVAFLLTHTLLYGSALLVLGASFLPLGPLAIFWVLVVTVPVAFDLSDVVLLWLPRPDPLPRLDTLSRQPRVALLYLTCDDYVWSSLAAIGNQSYEALDCYVLDDSRNPLPLECVPTPAIVVRRATRAGFKAGNINHWLRLYGASYEYIVVLDSDSELPPHFVSDMLKFAEHPKNAQVANFQALTFPSAPETMLQRCLAAGHSYRMRVASALQTHSESILSWGHNNLIRVSALEDVGGFDEAYVAEDAATTLRLIHRGYFCKIVEVVSYEGIPGNLEALASRTLRWTRQTLQILGANWSGIRLCTKLQILRPLASYLLHPILLASLCVAALSQRFSNDRSDDILQVRFVFIQIASLVGMPLALAVAKWPLARAAKTTLRAVIVNQFVMTSLSCYLMVPTTLAIVRHVAGERFTFTPTSKDAQRNQGSSSYAMLNVGVLSGLIVASVTLRGNYRFSWIGLAIIALISFLALLHRHISLLKRNGDAA